MNTNDNIYIHEFQNNEDILREFDAPKDALDGTNVLLAYYSYENYEGTALVIFEKNGELYEVNGSHCSCNGLEQQWKPEITNWEALEKRAYPYPYLAELVEKHRVK